MLFQDPDELKKKNRSFLAQFFSPIMIKVLCLIYLDNIHWEIPIISRINMFCGF